MGPWFPLDSVTLRGPNNARNEFLDLKLVWFDMLLLYHKISLSLSTCKKVPGSILGPLFPIDSITLGGPNDARNEFLDLKLVWFDMLLVYLKISLSLSTCKKVPGVHLGSSVPT